MVDCGVEVNGGKTVRRSPGDSVSATKSLIISSSDARFQAQELAVNQVGDNPEAGGSAELIGRSKLDDDGESVTGGEVDSGRKMDHADGGMDSEARIGSVSNENGAVQADIVLNERLDEEDGAEGKEEASFASDKVPIDDSIGRSCVTAKPRVVTADATQRENTQGDDGRMKSLENQAMETGGEDVHKTKILGNSDKGLFQHSGKPTDDSELMDLDPYVSRDRIALDVSSKKEPTKPGFSVSDLVWGKVRSHPWWPGQILDPSDASDVAKRHSKKGSYLIAYFGDHTFAWNELSKMKHFRSHYLQMEKQSSLLDFHDALDTALREVSRRTEFGLACSCIPREEFDKFRTQKIENAGIREESSIKEAGDRFSTVASFEPSKLVEYVKALACVSSSGVTERLQYVTIRAQLSALHRWRGYPRLPEYQTLAGSLETKPEASDLGQTVKYGVNDTARSLEVDVKATDTAKSDEVDEKAPAKKAKSEEHDSPVEKQNRSSVDDSIPRKREKTLLEMIAEKRLSSAKSKNRSEDNSILLSLGKKRKREDSVCDEFIMKHKTNHSSSSEKHKTDGSVSGDSVVKQRNTSKKLQMEDLIFDDLAADHGKLSTSSNEKHKKGYSVSNVQGHPSSSIDSKSLPAKSTFRVGLSILKVASQLRSSSILKPCGENSQRASSKTRRREDSKSEAEDISQANDQFTDKKTCEDNSQRPSGKKRGKEKLKSKTEDVSQADTDDQSGEKLNCEGYSQRASSKNRRKEKSESKTEDVPQADDPSTDRIICEDYASKISDKSGRKDKSEHKTEDISRGDEAPVSGNKEQVCVNNIQNAMSGVSVQSSEQVCDNNIDKRPKDEEDSEKPVSGNKELDNANPEEQASVEKQGGTLAPKHESGKNTPKYVRESISHQLIDSDSQKKHKGVDLQSNVGKKVIEKQCPSKGRTSDREQSRWVVAVVAPTYDNLSDKNTFGGETKLIPSQISDSDLQQKDESNDLQSDASKKEMERQYPPEGQASVGKRSEPVAPTHENPSAKITPKSQKTDSDCQQKDEGEEHQSDGSKI